MSTYQTEIEWTARQRARIKDLGERIAKYAERIQALKERHAAIVALVSDKKEAQA